VRDENGRQVFRRAPDAGEAQANLARTEPGIHQHARLVGFDVGSVAGGTAAENREFDCHARTVRVRAFRGNVLVRRREIQIDSARLFEFLRPDDFLLSSRATNHTSIMVRADGPILLAVECDIDRPQLPLGSVVLD
jgi:hypothetical protein